MFAKQFGGLVFMLGLLAGGLAWAGTEPGRAENLELVSATAGAAESKSEPLCCKKLASCCPRGPCCPKR